MASVKLERFLSFGEIFISKHQENNLKVAGLSLDPIPPFIFILLNLNDINGTVWFISQETVR